ncbi:hypothetical protein CONPUDRAFT_78098 [Coniophora puteana RWD-64-598 SS2]|uniref:Uncharacterized protein n=1 Tax=Coniophora puteana (strain RWD-64-598) TaxID=741705 RepID=R7SEZ9_CONPW|nr:uncharacterized protein CONPUDRAFT_78098 [Coniophora puteana RWD-64-598 SS2]EIW74455.1 hypothetical protein CONPUDRAFT_78098 [Coniophora puteana RWD-64-598 SS2]
MAGWQMIVRERRRGKSMTDARYSSALFPSTMSCSSFGKVASRENGNETSFARTRSDMLGLDPKFKWRQRIRESNDECQNELQVRASEARVACLTAHSLSIRRSMAPSISADYDLFALRAEVDSLRATLSSLVDRVVSRQTEEQYLRIELNHLRSLASPRTLPLRIPDLSRPDGLREYKNLQTYIHAAVQRAETLEHDLSPCLGMYGTMGPGRGRVESTGINACFEGARMAIQKTLEPINTCGRDETGPYKDGVGLSSENVCVQARTKEDQENVPVVCITTVGTPLTPMPLSYSEGSIGIVGAIAKHTACISDPSYLAVPTSFSYQPTMTEPANIFSAHPRTNSSERNTRSRSCRSSSCSTLNEHKSSPNATNRTKDLPPTPESVYNRGEISLMPPPQKTIRSRTNISSVYHNYHRSSGAKTSTFGNCAGFYA